jgi:hypothetical protein
MTEPMTAQRPSANSAQRIVLAVGAGGAIAVIAGAVTALLERSRETWVTVGRNVSGYTPTTPNVSVSYSPGPWWGWVALVWLVAVALWSALAFRLLRTR